MKTLHDLFLEVAQNGLKRQLADGSMPPGHNGLYRHPETPVRNTAHFLITFSKAFHLTDETPYETAARRCLDHLLKDCPHREEVGFAFRDAMGGDRSNGLIGPAWLIEALVWAANFLESPQALALGKQLFLNHPLNTEVVAWHRIEPDGRKLSPDGTFNHQLWFAAAAAPLAMHSSEIAAALQRFLESLPKYFLLNSKGRITHNLMTPRSAWRIRLKRLLDRRFARLMKEKEIGYQAFNLLAFGMLRQAGASLPSLVGKRVERAFAYLETTEFREGIGNSKFGYPYNPPGWEIPVAHRLWFGQPRPDAPLWFTSQVDRSFNASTSTMDRDTPDAETLTARTYELARLPDEDFAVPLSISPS